MSLRNDGSKMFDWNGNPLIPSMTLFVQADRRIREKKQVIEDLQNECELLEQQAFNLYKSHVNYFFMMPELIEKTIKWFSMKKSGTDSEGNKLDGRRKYEEKETAEYFINNIKKLLDIDDIEIDCIMDYNFGEAKEIVFRFNGHKWMLSIPIVNSVRIDSFRHYGDESFKLYISHYDSEHCTSRIGSTFDEEKLKEIMLQGIEKYCK